MILFFAIVEGEGHCVLLYCQRRMRTEVTPVTRAMHCEVPGSNLLRSTGCLYRGSLWYFSVISGECRIVP
jgi:hypothetical protein